MKTLTEIKAEIATENGFTDWQAYKESRDPKYWEDLYDSVSERYVKESVNSKLGLVSGLMYGMQRDLEDEAQNHKYDMRVNRKLVYTARGYKYSAKLCEGFKIR
jgi:hypothetical protein